ncbi:hypothetical protein [Pedobacter cryoconitis]|uniref:Uncharacterized protein n=1 Tax=Pedobacter cryoconitis TaxID=188932 RepID=A0A7X0J2P9_9SPHI|nr:hypothetical protein [Pedobacter cryoconitis]MBB6499994.1 hypothetical protein [Pedobacter cryoconitis]
MTKKKISIQDSIIVGIAVVVPLLFLIGFVFHSIISSPSTVEIIQKDNLMKHFNGRINRMHFDEENHNVKYAVSTKTEKFPIFRNWEPYIEIGDSLSKTKNSFKLEVYKKNGSKIIFDYRDNYKRLK